MTAHRQSWRDEGVRCILSPRLKETVATLIAALVGLRDRATGCVGHIPGAIIDQMIGKSNEHARTTDRIRGG